MDQINTGHPSLYISFLQSFLRQNSVWRQLCLSTLNCRSSSSSLPLRGRLHAISREMMLATTKFEFTLTSLSFSNPFRAAVRYNVTAVIWSSSYGQKEMFKWSNQQIQRSLENPIWIQKVKQNTVMKTFLIPIQKSLPFIMKPLKLTMREFFTVVSPSLSPYKAMLYGGRVNTLCCIFLNKVKEKNRSMSILLPADMESIKKLKYTIT